jgi:hypothetical protein
VLHVTNGDVARELIEAEIPGQVLAWRDVLHEGPVPAGLSDAELRDVRARFLAESGWAPYAQTLGWLAERDRAVATAPEVTLWFEHDLYDQLQLLQILALASDQRHTVELVQHDRFLGEMEPGDPARLFERRASVTEAQWRLARRAWEAFRSSDPMDVQAVVDGDTAALPFLGSALRRHLQQYPARTSGLGRTERLIVEAVSAGVRRRHAVFEAVQEREEAPFMGDVVFSTYLERLEPLVGEDDELALTATGEAVLAGDQNWLDIGQFDRWLGGVHLDGRAPWRWDEVSERLVAVD